ncbi:hypothetical protein C6A85_16305, partial [Mycobacterium sp. ITM-2017-0098]
SNVVSTTTHSPAAWIELTWGAIRIEVMVAVTVRPVTGSPAVPHADLLVGPNTYAPSDRFFGRTLGAEVAPGIAQEGSWVFDVA